MGHESNRVGPLPPGSSEKQKMHEGTQTPGAEARSYWICCASGRESFCLSSWPLACPFPALPAAWPWPWLLTTHIHTCVLVMQRGGASSLFFGFLFKPIQFDGSWAAALTQEQGKAVPEGEENCGDFLPGWAEGRGQ